MALVVGSGKVTAMFRDSAAYFVARTLATWCARGGASRCLAWWVDVVVALIEGHGDAGGGARSVSLGSSPSTSWLPSESWIWPLAARAFTILRYLLRRRAFTILLRNERAFTLPAPYSRMSRTGGSPMCENIPLPATSEFPGSGIVPKLDHS